MKTWARYAVLCSGLLLSAWLLYNDFSDSASYGENAPSVFVGQSPQESATFLEEGPRDCSSHSCFDYSKCGSELKVFVYPDVEELPRLKSTGRFSLPFAKSILRVRSQGSMSVCGERGHDR